MKALTVKQPYAEHIMRGTKTVENRSWQTPYRGRLVIHTGIRYDEGGFELPHGVILGVVDLIDVHSVSDPDWDCSTEDGAHEDSPFHWVLANPWRLLRPIDAAGKRHLWEVTPDLAYRIVDGLAANPSGQ